jgi:Cu/Ag efflux protein CusF
LKKYMLVCASLMLALSAAHSGAAAQTTQTQSQSGDAARPARQRVVGEVTAVDASASGLTVKTDAGETVNVTADEKTTIRRLPQGETSLDKAASATFADVRVGDRVLAVGVGATGGLARQLILTTRAAAAAAGQGRDDGRRLLGRVVSLDAAKKTIVVQTRGREGVETVNVDASGDVRFMRYAPDSSRVADAQASTFAGVRVGDQLRATGERAAGGGSFKAEEIIAGSFTRITGQVASVDASRGELTLKNEQTGQTYKVAVGQRTTIRRVTPEFIKTVTERAEQMRAQREARRAEAGGGGQQGGGQQQQGDNNGARANRPEGAGREGGGRGQGGGREGRGEGRGGGGGGRFGGGGFGGGGGNMFDSLPTVTLAELKKGDAVMITATPGADASSATAVSIVTGDADFLRRMQPRGDGGGQRGMSPGLPGDVIGTGTGGNREPPR